MLLNDEKLSLRSIGFSSFDKAISFAIKQNLTHVDLRNLPVSDSTLINMLLKTNKEIEFLALTGINHSQADNNLSVSVPVLGKLKTLIIHHFDNVTFEKLENLERLELISVDNNPDLDSFENLKYIDLEDMVQFDQNFDSL